MDAGQNWERASHSFCRGPAQASVVADPPPQPSPAAATPRGLLGWPADWLLGPGRNIGTEMAGGGVRGT